jgi:hypothetical protein
MDMKIATAILTKSLPLGCEVDLSACMRPVGSVIAATIVAVATSSMGEMTMSVKSQQAPSLSVVALYIAVSGQPLFKCEK